MPEHEHFHELCAVASIGQIGGVELANQLSRESDLVAAKVVRELMSARNLHIVDVFDTDPRGKPRRHSAESSSPKASRCFLRL